jgi:hypothetical protein
LSQRLSLTAPQLNYWSAQAESPSLVFIIASCINLNGDMQLPLLFNTIDQAVSEAEALHVRFNEDENGPKQIFELVSYKQLEVKYINFSNEENPLAAAQSWMRARAAMPFNLGLYPLFENAVLRLGEQRHILFGRCHHIVCDGYGFQLLAKRAAELYTHAVCGKAARACPFGSLKALVDEQHAYRDSPRFEMDRAYWRKASRLFELPSEWLEHRAGCELPTLMATSRISGALAARLDAIGRPNGGSLANVVLAASVVALRQLSGGKYVPINLPMMNRVGRVARRTPGMCASLLPLQVTIAAGSNYDGLIAAVAKAMRELVHHQQFPIEDLYQDLQVNLNAREHGRMTIVNIMLFDGSLQFGTCRGSQENIELGVIDNVSICADEVDEHGGFRLAVLMNPAIYVEATARSLQFCLFRLLVAIAADPTQCIDNIDLCPTGCL